MADIRTKYFNWLCQLVKEDTGCHKKLLGTLFGIDFFSVVEMDENREKDGTDLRYRFGCENGYDDRIIVARLDIFPCSLLEMLVALALRCEKHIMSDPDFENRTSEWFHLMIYNLGLGGMTDNKFDEDEIRKKADIFLNRKYNRDGSGGGLFVLRHCKGDMRKAEIWYQLCWYLESREKGETEMK